MIKIVIASMSLLCSLSTALAAEGTPPMPAELRIVKSGFENLFTNAAGFTLYTYDRDSTPGESTCIGACAKTWPPFTAAADAKPIGSFTLVERDDGARQWAYRGKPLYTYTQDLYPGAAFGKDFGNAWRVAFGQLAMPSDVTITEGPYGRALANQAGITLYSPRAGSADLKSLCSGKCLAQWRPHPAPMVANDKGSWSVLTRPDGSRQWAFNDKPLFTSVLDRRPGDTLGQVDEAGDWEIVLVRPPPPAPAWMKLVETDIGQVYADARGMTLYAFRGDFSELHRTTCNAECVAAHWTAVVAESEAAPVGDWSVLKQADGSWQWAYRGQLLYTHSRDRKPGDTAGDKFAAGVAVAGPWAPIRRKVY